MNKDKYTAKLNQKINDMLAMRGSQNDHYYRRGIEWARDLAQSEPEETCTYIRWDDDCNTWECNKCGEPWTLLDGGPKENNMNFCPNCGRKLVEKAGE